MKRNGSRSHSSQSRRSRKPGFIFYIPAPLPSEAGMAPGPSERASGCIGLLLSTALDLFRSVQEEKNFFLSFLGGREGGREGGSLDLEEEGTSTRIEEGAHEGGEGGKEGRQRMKKNSFGNRCSIRQRESEKRSGGDAVWCHAAHATNVHFPLSSRHTRTAVPPFIWKIQTKERFRKSIQRLSIPAFDHWMKSCIFLPASSRGNVKASSNFRTAASE